MPAPGYQETKSGCLSPIDLHHIIDGISADKRLKFIPSDHWTFNATHEAIIYDRGGLLEKKAQESVGLVYRNVGYAIHSNAKKSAWEYVDKAIRNVGRRIGKDLIAPRSVISLIRAVEEERVETMQRSEYDELGNTALPLRHVGYRLPYFAQDLEKIAAIQPIGVMHDEVGIPDYWLRVGIALKAVGSTGVDATELPEDMPWDAALCDEIRALKDKQSIDEMMHGMIQLLPKLVAARVEHEEPPAKPSPSPDEPEDQKPDEEEDPGQSGAGEDPSESGQGESEDDGTEGSGKCDKPSGQGKGSGEPNDCAGDGEGEGKGQPNGKGNGTPETPSSDPQDGDATPEAGEGQADGAKSPTDTATSKPDAAGKPGKADKKQIDPDLLGKLQEETLKTSTEDNGKELDFLGGAGDEISQSGEETAEDAMSGKGFEGGHSDDKTERYEQDRIVPAWPAVFGTATGIVGSIRKAVSRHFLENETGHKETGLRRGKLDVKRVIGNKMSGVMKDDVYMRRIIKDNRKYAVYILDDVSGSMSATIDGTACDQSVFGLFQSSERWMLAARFTVALTEILGRFRGIQVGIGVHDEAYMPAKEFADPLTAERKCFILNQIGAFGCTDADHAYEEIAKKFAATSADKKMLIHLTDGAFGGAVADQIRKLERMGVYVAVLTVGIDAQFARQYVPVDQADEINDTTIGEVLNRHFSRMIAA